MSDAHLVNGIQVPLIDVNKRRDEEWQIDCPLLDYQAPVNCPESLASPKQDWIDIPPHIPLATMERKSV